MAVVREQYLRTDLACRSSLCFEDNCRRQSLSTVNGLPSNVTHYLVPFIDVAGHYMDILEMDDFSGIIFFQTVVNVIKVAAQGGLYRRLTRLVKDPKKASVFFANEFFEATALQRQDGESITHWRGRLVHKAAVWYYEHLGGQKPVVIVTEDQDLLKTHQNSRLEVFVIKLSEYLGNFWPKLSAAHTLYESLRAAHTELQLTSAAAAAADGTSSLGDILAKKKRTGYEDHWKPEAVEAGLKAGKLIQGTLIVNKYHSQQEATVMPRSGQASSSGSKQEEVLIAGNVSRNRAVHGDLVAVQLLPKSEWKSKLNKLAKGAANDTAKKSKSNDDKDDDDDFEEEEEEEEKWERRADVSPTGKVVAIVTRRWKAYAASYSKDRRQAANANQQQRILVCPYDRRIPKVRIVTSQASSFAGKRIVIRIDNWPSNSQYPNGHFVRVLGGIGDLEAELDAILVEHDIADCTGPFSRGIMAELPPEGGDWKPEAAEVERRRDLRRSHTVMSIDPKGCTDVDDTLSVRTLSNGKVELGVHIADVAHFVQQGSLTDLEAKRRATTVYLADRRFNMLPAVLSSDLCSLLGGVDRYAVSVIWELDPNSNYKVSKVWYGRTVIKSSYKMTYEAAQAVIDGVKTPEELKYEVPEWALVSDASVLAAKHKSLRSVLLLLTKVAKRIQDNREGDGALKLESGSEVQFEFESNSPIVESVKPKEHLAVHETVAECMIFANHWVAKKIAKAFPRQALLRRHPSPSHDAFAELKSCAASRGWDIDVWSNKLLAESLDRCVDPQDPNVNMLLRSLATQAMEQAVYFSTGSQLASKWEHYGLALQHYTHFTSPIRRYADVIVHRLLLAALRNQDWWNQEDEGNGAGKPLDNSELTDLCEHVNERNKAAQLAQRQSQLLFQTLYFRNRAPDDPKCVVEAVVFGIRENGFIVYVPCYALKGPVYLQQRDDSVLYLHRTQGPVWKAGKVRAEGHSVHVEPEDGKRTQTYNLFDHVMVTIQLKKSSGGGGGGSDEDAHARSLAFLLLGRRRPAAAAAASKNGNAAAGVQLDKAEVNFLREIKKKNEEEEEGCKLDSDWEEEEVEAGNDVPGEGATPSKKQRRDRLSMYRFFEDMKQMGETVPQSYHKK